jgi:hypothetical protein
MSDDGLRAGWCAEGRGPRRVCRGQSAGRALRARQTSRRGRAWCAGQGQPRASRVARMRSACVSSPLTTSSLLSPLSRTFSTTGSDRVWPMLTLATSAIRQQRGVQRARGGVCSERLGRGERRAVQDEYFSAVRYGMTYGTAGLDAAAAEDRMKRLWRRSDFFGVVQSAGSAGAGKFALVHRRSKIGGEAGFGKEPCQCQNERAPFGLA